MSILRQNEQHEQIEIMANYGPFCKRIKKDKENILNLIVWNRQTNVKWCVFKVTQYIKFQINNKICSPVGFVSMDVKREFLHMRDSIKIS